MQYLEGVCFVGQTDSRSRGLMEDMAIPFNSRPFPCKSFTKDPENILHTFYIISHESELHIKTVIAKNNVIKVNNATLLNNTHNLF